MATTEVVVVTDAELDPVLIVEAALFSAGKPVGVDEIAQNTGLDKRKVLPALKELHARYAAASSALEIGRAGDKWGMQVRTAYAPSTTKLAPMEIPIKLLKTLALIAYHQPVLQSDLKEMVGDKVYDHIRELQEAGLVRKRVHERSFLLVTSDRFPEYFGIPAADREGIKHFLADKVGLALPTTDKDGNRKLSTFPEGEPSTNEPPHDSPA
ncbi:MAG: segregation and condensation protein [Thermoplasmata archaeon]|jgi:segregation and condensation protein B|nr:segregation and condensation protein [Thermoplasmata archaeon]